MIQEKPSEGSQCVLLRALGMLRQAHHKLRPELPTFPEEDVKIQKRPTPCSRSQEILSGRAGTGTQECLREQGLRISPPPCFRLGRDLWVGGEPVKLVLSSIKRE